VSLRTRILFASALLVLIPLLLLALGIRREMGRRLTVQYTRRVETLVQVIEDDLTERSRDLAGRLAALKAEIRDDNRFRLAAVDGEERERPYLLDYSGRAMNLMGLSMLQVQDGSGRILSSGHFRNEYDRFEPGLPRLLATAPDGTALVRARRPDGTFLALARVDSLRLGGRRYTLVGGISAERAFLSGLARDHQLAVSLVFPGGALSSDPAVEAILARAGQGLAEPPGTSLLADEYLVRTLDLPLALPKADGAGDRTGTLGHALLVVSHPRSPLRDLLTNLDRWLAVVLVATALGTLVLAIWMSVRISRPIHALAKKTATIDLDHLDADFDSDRRDEVGVLSRFLAAMARRLRASVELLRKAERRAALGEMARQVNHDIRNGMAPIQNVVRHLGQVARETPGKLGEVFLERQSTIETSLAYLDDLATNYARLSPRLKRQSLDLNEIVRQVVPAPGLDLDGKVTVELDLADPLPQILADPIGLRRIVENLVRNARESLGDGPGTVTVTTEAATDAGGEELVTLVVRDTGRGMRPEDVKRIFEHFYTTKEGGSGLGLSIVRRLVSDFEGSVQVESEPGRGTRLTISLPAVEPGSKAR
jgi:signal transduction histidine kinase